MSRLSGKVALITGGASGMGAATVRRFVAEGAAVVFTDIQVEKGEALAAETGARFIAQDVASESGWRDVMATITDRHGRLDFTMNNAGMLSYQNIEQVELETWHKVLGVNLTGVMLGCRHSIELMRQNSGGSIVNISSIGGFVGLAADAAYTATKGAVRLMTKSIAVHCAREKLNIRCNSLHPGSIDTPILHPATQASPDPEGFRQFLHNMAPMGRMGTGEDIAGTAVFLASDDSSYITGTEILVDGGLLAGTPGF